MTDVTHASYTHKHLLPKHWSMFYTCQTLNEFIINILDILQKQYTIYCQLVLI